MTALMLSYTDAAAAGPAVVGGKGWNLGRLDRYGFAVPAGGVLAAEVYTQVMATEAVRARQREVADTPADAVADPTVQARLAALRETIATTALPARAMRAVRDFLSERGLSASPVAVRSSATAEDSAQASFAGVHRSFLNVVGLDDVLQAIQRCYASLWTPEAVAYRRHLSLRDEAVACAAVICAMVRGPGGGPPVAAGIAFTCEPRTGQRDRMAISVVPGLAERAVGGSVNPAELLVLHPDHPPARIERVRSGAYALADPEVHTLSQTLLRVQWALGDGQDPQDVEWAFDGQRFWVVQARPIVHLPRVTYAEAAALPVIWSTALVKDALPSVLTPLSWSTLRPGYRSVASFGDPARQPAGLELLRRFQGRVYVDMTSVLWSVYDSTDISPQRLTRMLLGQPVAIPVPPHPLLGPEGRRRLRALLGLARDYIQLMREGQRDATHLQAEARAYRAAALTDRADAQLIARYQQVADLMGDAMGRFRLNHLGIWNVLLARLLERFRPGHGHRLASALLAATDDKRETTDPGRGLPRLAAAAAADPPAREYLGAQPLDPDGWRKLPASSPFRQAFSAYLESFGHRGHYEAELANPRWSEDPAYLLTQVRLLLADETPQAPITTSQATRAAAEAEVSHLPLVIRPIVRWLAGQARQAAARREMGRSTFIMVSQVLRQLALTIGSHMARASVLDDPADVFYLTKVDLEAYASGTWDGRGARLLVADRRARREEWLRESPPDVLVLDALGHPARLSDLETAPALPTPAPRAPTTTDGNREVLSGIGAAAGRVSGRARIMREAKDGANLRAGEIVVAPSTDPGWTPLFLRASALATETGGYLSHGAIVAREYGIPAVVGIPGLLEHITDGQQLTVDGDTGEVIVEAAATPTR